MQTEGANLTSFDVISLHTSISQDGRMYMLKRALHNSYFSDEGKDFLLSLLRIVITGNYFLFNYMFYLQLRGSAMGASVSTYANIFVAMLEERFVYVYHHFQEIL